ncbi:uncharacterized protein BDR25DRAFT_202463, partial [Lindgomyces ingoldianus]
NNRVHLERIGNGSDVRTTIMLRNIPNKLDHVTLKSILDEHCFGIYDFVYLRIDFESGSNVGYAFINFNCVEGVVALVNNVAGRPWLGHGTSKAAEISYATIQGRDALVQKFRNSSVMTEPHFCQPHLFSTWLDALAAGDFTMVGTEVPFPGPDNAAKLQRSRDSARAVGLYPPHHTGANADHRNRLSQYDRGT